MKLNNILPIALVSFILVGCGATKPTAPVRVITATSYPELPNIEPLPPVALIPWKHDMPRDLNASSVKNITKCRKVETKINEHKPYVVEPVEKQPDKWWAECGENPIVPKSNIHIGFDIENWNIILEDFYKLKERTWQYEQRLTEINKQRQKWRDDADAERAKAAIDNKAAENESAPEDEPSFLKKLFGN